MNPTRAREAPASVGGQILIIDGADDARCRLVGALEREGHTVVTADAGDEAARWLAELDFDAVLSDVLMPGSGDPAVAAVGVISPGTEVVILGGDDEDAAIEAVRGGAFDVLTRPVHAARLIASIARAVEHRRLKAAGALYELSQIMFDARDAEHLPGMIVGVTMRVMGADDVSLMLPDADMNLHIAHSCGLGADVQREARIGLGERVAGRVARDLTPALLHRELDTDPRFQGVANFRRIRSSIVYPVVAQGRLLAVLNMNRISLARPFHRADLARAGVLASKVALALENAELVRRLVAAERFATVGQIASSVVHEINNPLAAVLTGLAFAVEQLASIVDAPADGPVADALAAAEDALTGAERVREIVRDVRALARKDDPATRDVFDLAGPIRSAVRTIGRCHPGRGVTVGAQVEDGVRILGSEGSMGQVFTNLLANAMQAINDSSEASGRIDVVARREGDRAIVDVIDSGPGIAEENMPRLFEPLFTTKPGDRGTGLGLFISREIVERHGGDIGVRKAPGRGTIVTIRLPLAG